MSLTYKQAIDIYNNVRKNKREKPKIADFKQKIFNHILPNSENYLDDSNLNIITSKIEAVYRKITKYFVSKTKRLKFASEFPMNDVCLSFNEYSTSKKARTNKPIDVASKRQQYRRLQAIVDMIKEVAVEEKTTEHYLIGLILRQIYYHSDRKIADIGTKLMNLEESTKVPVEVASSLKCFNNLGRESYQREVRALRTSGFDVLPSWKMVRSFEKSITPDIQQLPDGLGVEFDYRDAILISLQRIFEGLDENQLTGEDLTLDIKDGMDGSGSHSIFNQSG